MMDCTDCGKGLGKYNRSGLCVQCFNRSRNSDPAFQERRLEGIRRKYKDPLHRAKMAATILRNSSQWHATPEGRAWLVWNGKRLAAEVLSRPDVKAKSISPEARAKAKRSKEETILGWCPAEYRPTYKFLRRVKKLSKAEAVEAVLEQARADLAKLSPFERQQRALEKGAKLVANDHAPMFGEALKTA